WTGRCRRSTRAALSSATNFYPSGSVWTAGSSIRSSRRERFATAWPPAESTTGLSIAPGGSRASIAPAASAGARSASSRLSFPSFAISTIAPAPPGRRSGSSRLSSISIAVACGAESRPIPGLRARAAGAWAPAVRMRSDVRARRSGRRSPEGLPGLLAALAPPRRGAGRTAAASAVPGSRSRQLHAPARRGPRDRRRERRRQERADRWERPSPGQDRLDPRARLGVPSGVHRPAEHRAQRRDARPLGRGGPREDPFDPRVRRARRLHRPAGQGLLDRHGDAPGLRDRDAGRARRPDHRRGALGGRRLFPEEVHGPARTVRRVGRDAAVLLARHVLRLRLLPAGALA